MVAYWSCTFAFSTAAVFAPTVASSDVAVASDRATFRVPELFRGIADTHYGHILARHVGPARARDLMFTGRKLSVRAVEPDGSVIEAFEIDAPT